MPITISFTEDQLKILNMALIELPYRLAAPMISHINAEIQRSFDLRHDDITGEVVGLDGADSKP